MLTMELGAITREPDGTYTVSVRAVRDTDGKVAGQKTFQANSAAELKDAIKPVFEALVAAEKSRENIRTIAQGVLDEIMMEVTQ